MKRSVKALVTESTASTEDRVFAVILSFVRQDIDEAIAALHKDKSLDQDERIGRLRTLRSISTKTLDMALSKYPQA